MKYVLVQLMPYELTLIVHELTYGYEDKAH